MPGLTNRYGFRIFQGKTKELIKEHVLGINPQDLDHTEPVKVNVIETFGGAFADDHGNAVSQMINISGHTGYRGHGGYLSGAQEFMSLREDIFRNRIIDDTIMVFDNYEDNEHYVVVFAQFVLRRSSNRPLMYNYSIQMRTLGKYEDMLFKWYDAIAKGINDVISQINELTNAIKTGVEAVRDSVTLAESAIEGMINATLVLVETAVASVETIQDLETEIQNFPNDLYQQSIVRIAELMGITEDKLRWPEVNYKLNNALKNLMFAMQTSLQYAKSMQTNIDLSNKKHTVTEDETLYDIAATQLGDATRWKEILDLNQLKIEDFGPGKTLMLPDKVIDNITIINEEPKILVTVSPMDKIANQQLTEKQYNDVYLGTDLDRRIEADAMGRLKEKKGLDNLQQITEDRMSIALKDLTAHPEFGTIIPELIGNTLDDLAIKKVKLEVRRMLLQDDRIEDVINIDIYTEDEKFYCSMDMIVKNGLEMSVISPLS